LKKTSIKKENTVGNIYYIADEELNELSDNEIIEKILSEQIEDLNPCQKLSKRLWSIRSEIRVLIDAEE